MPRVLVCCEESQIVASAFYDLGCDSYSCDLKPSSGCIPDRHIIGDCFEVAQSSCWDLIIAHPPCTYLSNSNSHSYFGDDAVFMANQRILAASFFLRFFKLEVPHLCVENPVGLMNRIFRKPDQIIDPYQFSEPSSSDFHCKRTCFWLNNLPPLVCSPRGFLLSEHWVETRSGSGLNRQELRSKFFPGVAHAMAYQWIGIISR